jgi:TatD DNase family protein
MYTQISLAIEMNKPIMFHQKGAHEDFLCIIKTHMPLMIPAILHSFTGSFEEATDYINLGMYIGITGMYSNMFYNMLIIKR